MLPLTAPVPRLGMNLSGPADWNSELPFTDVFRTSRAWISQREGAGWGQGPKLELDARGYPKRLEPGCRAETPMLTDLDGHYPGGDYTVTYKGKGKIALWGPVAMRSEAPGRIVAGFDDKKKDGVFLRLLETDPADPVRDIHVWMPGYADGKTEFRPEFLRRWRGMAAFRFMDWMNTNGSEETTWESRPKPGDMTYSTKGVPVEVMVRLCNLQNADGWFCMPHAATDEYMANFAAYVAKNLKPNLKAYVEYSNEVWNPGFEQHRYAAEQGAKRQLGTDQYHNAWHWTARRSVEMFDLWSKGFVSRPKTLVRVLAAQAGWAEPAKEIVAFEGAGKKADLLAVAPYFGFTPGPETDPKASEVSTWDTARVLNRLGTLAIPEALQFARNHVPIARAYGLKLGCYEAGQHAVGVGGGENDERLTALLTGANRAPGMAELYGRYLDGLSETIDGPIMLFSSVGRYSKWGSWGAAEFYDEPATPKLRAIAAWAAKTGHPIGG